MRRYGWLLCVLFLVACGAQSAETPTSPPATPTPSPRPDVTATPTPTETPAPSPTTAPTATPGSGSLQSGGDFAHAIDGGMYGFYTLEGEVGDAVRITVTTEDEALDLRLVVVAPGERELVRLDAHGPGEAETLAAFPFPVSGVYHVRVEAASGEGFMQGNLIFLPAAVRSGGGTFASFESEPISARMDAPATFHLYQFAAPLGQVIIMQATPEDPELDLYFYIFNPDGSVLGRYDDEVAPNIPSVYDTRMPDPGVYTVLVGAKAGTGAYQMALQQGG